MACVVAARLPLVGAPSAPSPASRDGPVADARVGVTSGQLASRSTSSTANSGLGNLHTGTLRVVYLCISCLPALLALDCAHSCRKRRPPATHHLHFPERLISIALVTMSTTNPPQLFLLADHIKLSLLERQRAISLNLSPNTQDGQISRSLETLRSGIESLQSQVEDTADEYVNRSRQLVHVHR